MKIYLLLVTIISMSFGTAHSQIRTGGAGAPGEGGIHDGYKILKKFEKHLISRDKSCSPSSPLLKNSDLMQAYLKLSLVKSSKTATEYCDSPDQYFACLSDEKTTVLIEQLKENKWIPTLLMTTYQISSEEAEKMVKFFIEIEKKP